MKTDQVEFVKLASRLLNNMRARETVTVCGRPTPDGKGVCQARPHDAAEPHVSLQIVSWGDTPRALTDLAKPE